MTKFPGGTVWVTILWGLPIWSKPVSYRSAPADPRGCIACQGHTAGVQPGFRHPTQAHGDPPPAPLLLGVFRR